MPAPMPVVLDTDIGNDPDDLLALAMILDRSDRFDLRGVITTGEDPGRRAAFVKYLCELSGRKDIPIGTGSVPAKSKEPTGFHSSFFGRAGAEILNTGNFPNALQVLSDVISPELTIITIGPLTTLADTIIAAPAMADQFCRVVSMGGFISRKAKREVPEYNFGVDPFSTRVVLGQGFEHICVTKNACSKVLMKPEHISARNLHGSPARRFAFSFMAEWFKGRSEKKLHDPLAVSVALEPDTVALERVFLEVTNEGRCRGNIVHHGQRYATIGGTPADLSRFFDLFYGGEG